MEVPRAHPSTTRSWSARRSSTPSTAGSSTRGLEFWADPGHRQPGVINTNDGGRGLYWDDPNGHNLEILTVPYGGWPA